MTSLIPKSFFSNFPSLRRATLGRFPTSWEDWENQLSELFEEQSGLTIYEDQKNVYVEASMPGLTPSDIEITWEKGVLRIKGEKKQEEQDKEKKFYRRSATSFSYQVAVPGQIDETKEPSAGYKDGIMKIAFAKSKQGQAKKIQVKGG